MEKFERFINHFDIEKSILDEENKCIHVPYEKDVANLLEAINTTVDKIMEKYKNEDRVFDGEWSFSPNEKEILIFFK